MPAYLLVLDNCIRVLSANCQGLQNKQKRVDVLQYLRETNANIICLQDTHWTKADIPSIKSIWGNTCYIHGKRSNARGVAILITDNFEYEVLESNFDVNGNYICLTLKLNALIFNLVTIYAPNNDSPEFFTEIQNVVQKNESDYNIICGDYNLILDQALDSNNYKHVNNPKARSTVLSMMSNLSLSDIYRQLHPTCQRYTWRKRNPLKQARLDFFLITDTMSDLVKTCDIKAGYRSDHSIITMDIVLSKFNQGKGTWKFNNSLLQNQDYLNLVNKIIQEELLKYAIPVYSLQYIEENPDSISLTLDDELFLEVLLLRIRGETIKFASHLKKENDKNEKQLLRDIETLESDNSLLTSNIQLLMDKKRELQKIRENKIKGQQVRSKLQWLKDGEKPTRFFCNLENKNFVEKTVKKIQNNNGEFVMDQREILKSIRSYYAALFKNRDNMLDEVNLQKLLNNIKINKVSDSTLENTIEVFELGQVLKSMKNNKSPGIDGITAEFLKVFWRQLKIFICKAINSCFNKGQLSTSLYQGIIICIPKGQKDRSLMKNWRPITLLSIIYKLASGVIAQRLKKTLPIIISKTQTGFLSGRSISDNTRLIYDIMHITQAKNIPGLLMLIDFEKAFDLISWKFIYKALLFLVIVVNLFAGYNFSIQILRHISSNADIFQSVFPLGEDVAKETLFLHICF